MNSDSSLRVHSNAFKLNLKTLYLSSLLMKTFKPIFYAENVTVKLKPNLLFKFVTIHSPSHLNN